MRGTRTALVAVVLLASACGTALTDEEALRELGTEGASGIASAAPVATAGAVGGDAGDALAPVAGDPSAGEATAAGAVAAGPDATTPTSAAVGPAAAAAANVSRGGATDVGVTDREIRLGWVGTLTGPQPGLFRGALIGIQAFANYQNSQGGLMGRRLVVVSSDDALDSGKNRAAHLQLKDRVFAFVGSFSVNDDGGAAVINDCKCPDITGNLSRAMHESPYHYGPLPATPGWWSGPPRYYARTFGPDVVTKTAFLYSQNAVTEAIAREQRRVYEEAGFRIVYSRAIPPNDSNQTADVVQMQRAGVRAIVYSADVTAMTKLATAMRQQNFKVDLLNLGNAIYDSNTFKLAQPETLGGLQVDHRYAMFLGEDAERTPEVRLFAEWLKRTDPRQPVDLFAMYGWLSGRLFADTMGGLAAQGRNPVRTELIDALRATETWDGHGMIAPVRLGAKLPSDCFFVLTATPDGRFARTFPEGSRNYVCDQGPFSPAR